MQTATRSLTRTAGRIEMVAKTQNMAWMRGDTAHIGIRIINITPDELTFSVKRYKADRQYVIQKTLGNGIEPTVPKQGDPAGALRYIVTIDPEDTEELASGGYYYDLEAIINGDVLTLLIGEVTIAPDVTRHLEGTEAGT